MNDLESVILNVPNDKGLGYFYWEPEWLPVENGTYATDAGVAYKMIPTPHVIPGTI